MVSSYIGAYWGPRTESVDQCAERVSRFLLALADVDPALIGWRDQGDSEIAALSNPVVSPDPAAIVDRLEADRQRDSNGQVLDEFGYLTSWWNAQGDAPVILTLSIGKTHPTVPNSVVVQLPEPASARNIYSLVNAGKIVSAVINSFDPQRLVWSNDHLREFQREPNTCLPNGGIAFGKLVGHPA